MKIVQDKDGNIIEVSSDTPCHAGKNGALPVMLDAVKDKAVFDEMEERRAAWEAKIDERYNKEVSKNRRKEYGTPEKQIEYLVEHGLDALIMRNQAIKVKHKKK